jgi:hypothetical protein
VLGLAKKIQRKKYLIEIVSMDKTQNVHTYIRTDNLFVKYKDENEQGLKIDTEIQPKHLYEKKVGFLRGWVRWLFTGITKEYIAILDFSGAVIEEKESKVSSRVLKVAKDWKGLDQAINSAFKKDLELPENLVLYIVGAIALILILLVATGRLNLSTLGVKL